jgi:endo-alpha-1,4-polygalactosaminidase (GH114 family)
MRALMRRGLAGIAGGALAATAALTLAGTAPAGPPPDPQSWAFAIGNGTVKGSAAEVGDRLGRFDLVVVDGEDTSANKVGAIHDEPGDTTVLAYLSVGTIEKWRAWYDEVKRFRLKAWQDWKDEWFADVSRPGLRRALADEIAPELLDKGFDGLFLDNTDMVETRKHRPQRRGMEQLIQMLDALTHGQGDLLFAQNGGPGMLEGYVNQDVDPLHTHFDGWNREDVTWTWDFDRHRYVRNPAGDRNDALQELVDIGKQGLITTATDYVNLGNDSTEAECESVANAEGAGALSYVADIGLTKKAVEANPPDCP